MEDENFQCKHCIYSYPIVEILVEKREQHERYECHYVIKETGKKHHLKNKHKDCKYREVERHI
ncbi:MAG: hypothetical protein PF693_10820 [Spirochaetia bacterium]|jgi:hypothetical protein|nr:hypothetical protein [Spirochaetia bacterium]